MTKIKNALWGILLPVAIFAAGYVLGLFLPALFEIDGGPVIAIIVDVLIQIPACFLVYKYARRFGTRIRQEPLRLGAVKTIGIMLAFAALCAVPTQCFCHVAAYAGPGHELLSALVIAPISEELLFRGAVFGSSRKYLGFLPATALSTVLFQAVHGHPVHAFLTVPMAICCCAAYEATGSLLLPIALHFTFNLTSALMKNAAIAALLAVSIYFAAMLVVIPVAIRIGIKAARKAETGTEA